MKTLEIKIRGMTDELILEELKTILFHLECGTVPGLHVGDCYSEVIIKEDKGEKP